jgi:hypothetical protein
VLDYGLINSATPALVSQLALQDKANQYPSINEMALMLWLDWVT